MIIGRLRRGSRCRNTAAATLERQVRVSATDQPSARVGQDQLEALGGHAGAKLHLSLEGELKSERDPAELPRPMEFDANGFPVPQRNSSFVKRVERLVDPL